MTVGSSEEIVEVSISNMTRDYDAVIVIYERNFEKNTPDGFSKKQFRNIASFSTWRKSLALFDSNMYLAHATNASNT